MKFISATACLALVCAAALADEAPAVKPADQTLTPYVSVYSVGWGGTTLGEGTITLAPQMDKDCYRFESQTHPMALVRLFYGSPRETSLFCVRDGVIRPQRFEYVNDKRDKDNFSLDFDWKARKVRALKNGTLTERELPDTAYDRFVMQQVVRLWVKAHVADEKPGSAEFNMADDDRVTTYRFEITGRENVQTPAGSFETVRVERTDNPKRILRSWLAPSRDYTPVKIEQIENGEVKLRMLLK